MKTEAIDFLTRGAESSRGPHLVEAWKDEDCVGCLFLDLLKQSLDTEGWRRLFSLFQRMDARQRLSGRAEALAHWVRQMLRRMGLQTCHRKGLRVVRSGRSREETCGAYLAATMMLAAERSFVDTGLVRGCCEKVRATRRAKQAGVVRPEMMAFGHWRTWLTPEEARRIGSLEAIDRLRLILLYSTTSFNSRTGGQYAAINAGGLHCFASSLTQEAPFLSPFPHLERIVGSLGSFPLGLREGVRLCGKGLWLNPPFVEEYEVAVEEFLGRARYGRGVVGKTHQEIKRPTEAHFSCGGRTIRVVCFRLRARARSARSRGCRPLDESRWRQDPPPHPT